MRRLLIILTGATLILIGALYVTVFSSTPVGQDTGAQTNEMIDHHLHIRSRLMGRTIGTLCGQLAECEPSELSVAVPAAKTLQTLDEAGIQRGLLLSLGYFAHMPELSLDAETAAKLIENENQFIAEQVEDSGGRLEGFFGLNPLTDNAVATVERWAADGRLAGMKLHFANSDVNLRDPAHLERVMAALKAAETNGLYVLVHMRTRVPDYGEDDVNAFIDLLAEVPDLHIIVAHFAGWGGYDANTQAAMKTFITAFDEGRISADRINFDTAAVILGNMTDEQKEGFVQQARAVGLDNLLFGSDWDGGQLSPFTPENALASLSQIGFTDAELAEILSNRAPVFE